MKETHITEKASQTARSQMPADDDEIDLMELVRALWRGKWIIVLSVLAAMSLAGYYVFGVAVSEYRSTAQLTLEMRTKQVVDIEGVISGASTEQAALNTEVEILLSRRILGQVADALDLVEDPEFNAALRSPPPLESVKAAVLGWTKDVLAELGLDDLVGQAAQGEGVVTENETMDREPTSARDRVIGGLRNALSAAVQRNTYVFTISATTQDPNKSAQIVNTLSDVYIQDQIAVKFEATEQAVAWLSTRVTELEQELREKENALKAATAETDLTSPEALEAQNLQAKDLRDRLQEMRGRLAQTEARLGELRNTQDRATIVEMTDDPTLQQLLAQIRDGAQEATQLFDQRLQTLVTRAKAERQRLGNQVDALAASYEKLQDRIDRQSEDLVQIQQMQREVETTRTLYETFLTRLKETTVQRGLQQADSRVLSDATPGGRVAPRPARIFALAMVLGAMIGAGFVLLRQFLHNTFRTTEELEAATGIPVLGQIPKIPIKSRDKLIGYLQDKPTSAAAEAIRNLRTSILLSDVDAPPKVVMSTSSVPREGKTTQAVALAQNMAGLGKKVLLIEGDIRRRTFSRYFDNTPSGGIIAALSNEVALDQIVFYNEELGADVLMGEKSRANAADLFSSDLFRSFLLRAREAYDFVVIDTPPVLVVPDARVIGQQVDAIIYTVAWDKTDRSQVIAGLREFESVNLRVTGLALAQIDPKGMRRYGYGGKYGAYSAYGRGYYEAG
ncbi:chain-length determining protein [Roseovarius sp. TE539]|uniref:GumC family protein n=1 Tax=Roseovarius sp. TE539 TaxID=2249812 RepID=UPI000DDFA74A|nr:polysaccharide biosynthesis tyrosine autokinase [Roseovarius sp. TE539]RBI67860.1 chain-length determining protein [Roseovarius sp. TE539]